MHDEACCVCYAFKMQHRKSHIPIHIFFSFVLFLRMSGMNIEYDEILKIIELILCLPGTTASVERVFSSMNKTWTKEKTRLQNDTLNTDGIILTTLIL